MTEPTAQEQQTLPRATALYSHLMAEYHDDYEMALQTACLRVAKLETERSTLKDQAARHTTALAFYADPANWRAEMHGTDILTATAALNRQSPAERDRGNRAREAKGGTA